MKPLKLLLILILVYNCASKPQAQTQKINGVSFVASREAVNESHVKPVIQVNANYAAVMPFGFIRDLEHPKIIFDTDRQWYGETRKGAKQYIAELRKQSISIMLKPQIWVWRGLFTGDIKMNTEEDWKMLEQSYSKFILEYAQLAQEEHVEIFCIGTELDEFIINRPKFWTKLISEIKNIYKGKLTYAANWDEFKRTPFWDQLDFIGIDAYFPVSDEQTPTVKVCLEGWKAHLESIKTVHKTFQKPILFTEFGYRSVDYAAKEPWRSDRSMNTVNLEAQQNATQALFDTFWNEDWFAGGFVWKWFHDHENVGGETCSRFTPQNKPAEAVIRKYYKSY